MKVASKPNGSFRILVAEDDPEMRALLTDELSDEGYEVIPAEDGEEAADKIAHEGFDLVITDIRMPNIGGFELLPIVKEVCPDIPVIVVTAFGDESSFSEAYEKGAVDYISKPFRILDLKNAVKQALKRKGG